MENINLYRTDLLVESEEMVRHQTEEEKEKLDDAKGIHFNEFAEGRVKVTKVVVNEIGAERIGKKEGTYITLTIPNLLPNDEGAMEQLTNLLSEYLTDMIEQFQEDIPNKIVVIGLGNRDVTPDAIGPFTIDRMDEIVPEYFTEKGGEVFIYAPGVTIQTGLETADFINAIVKEVEPDLLIVVDALAARSSMRLCKTIQLTDTGIHPGSGVGNNRKEVSKETIGIPVIAIGIPTVVDGPVLIADAIDTMFTYIAGKIEEENSPSSSLSVTPWLRTENKDIDTSILKPIFGDWAEWPHEERVQLFEEVLTNHNFRTFISPKEIDTWVSLYADRLAVSLMDWIRTIKK